MLSEVGLDEATVLERITCALNSEERPTLLSTGKIGVGLGMVSDILRVKVQWKNNTNYPQSFVIKVPSTHKMAGLAGDDCAANMSDHSLKEFHRGEIAAYIWLPCSERLGLKTPKCYFSQEIGDTDPGMLIIEDLSLAPNKGAVITTELSIAQIEEVMQQLAVLHGTSLIDDSWRSDDRLTKDIRPLLLENANWIAKSYEHACKEMMSKFPNELGEIAGRVLPALSDPTKDLTYMYTVNAELGMPDVLCHGDLTRINMMFDRDTNKLAAIFDWQLIHSGCAAEDIASFIVTSCSMDVRRNQLDHLLETYHSELTKICKGVAPFTLQQLQQAYQLCFKGVMLVTVPAFPYFIEKRAADPEMQASYISHVKSTMEDFADNLDKYHSPSSLTK